MPKKAKKKKILKRKVKKIVKLFHVLALFILAGLVVWLIVFMNFIPRSPEKLVFREKLEPADAIVVLSGETNTRMTYAVQLYQQNYAPKMFFPAGRDDQRIHSIIRKPRLQGIVVMFGNGATSTIEEALETKKFVKQYKIKRLILVTSSYHSYRAHWIFHKVMPFVDIISAPVPEEKSWFNPQKALLKGTLDNKAFLMEQKKALGYYLQYSWRIF